MAKLNVLFMGRKAVAAKALEQLSTMPDVAVVGVLTDNHLSVSPTTAMAEQLGIPVLGFDEALQRAESGELHFDLGISILYWRKIKGALLTVPRLGVINFHPAPLPEYKGTAGYNLAILHNLHEWGVTAHYMDHSIDTGGIIECDRFPIDQQRATVRALELECMSRIEAQVMRVLDQARAAAGRLATTPNVGGVYVSRPQMEAMKEIQPGDDVPRKIRAFWYPPYDGAYVVIDGNKYTLVDQSILASLADPSASSLFSTPANGEGSKP